MNKKGFTLIELLAVIVILAIIALIATPIIIGIINDARDEADQRSVELIGSGVEYAVTTYMYKNGGNVPTEASQIAGYFTVDGYKMEGKDISSTKKSGITCEVTMATGTDATVICKKNDKQIGTTKTIKLTATDAATGVIIEFFLL